MTTQQIYQDREAWLSEAADMILDEIILPHAPEGTVKPLFRVSCGWPKSSRGGARAVGTCHPRSASADGVNEIFVSPELDDPLRVLEVLAKACCHAVDDCESGHRGLFARLAVGIGMMRPLTVANASGRLLERLTEINEILGQYPHQRLTGTGRKKDQTRQIKCECTRCKLIVRMSRKAIDRVRALASPDYGRCPADCGGSYTLKLDV